MSFCVLCDRIIVTAGHYIHLGYCRWCFAVNGRQNKRMLFLGYSKLAFYLASASPTKLATEKLSLPKNNNFNPILLSPELDRLVAHFLTFA